ncbi:unnamed protein product, partial [Discosporangium mesarthrocarpum]
VLSAPSLGICVCMRGLGVGGWGLGQATREAICGAVAGLLPSLGEGCRPYTVLDGNDFPPGLGEGEAVVKGDRSVLVVAAASVLAKVTRDEVYV